MTREEEIRKLAYELYLKNNKRKDQTLNNWLKAEKIIFWRNRFFNLLKHPLFLIIVSGGIVWGLQQNYLQNQEKLKMKFEIMKKIRPIHATLYQEIWNEWHAFQNKQSSVEYRKNIQLAMEKTNEIETQIPILFRDREIYKDWKEILNIFWEAEYPISRQEVTEQQLNEKLNLISPLLDDLLNRMYKEVK